MNFVFIYYNNPIMLRKQIETWNAYDVLPQPPKVILIDDGSQEFPAIETVKLCPMRVPFELYRIEEDIAWNFSGARNLGCAKSDGWIHVSDMDTLVYPADASALMVAAVDREKAYLPRRTLIPHDQRMKPAIVNLTFHRSLFDRVGGYDEDYAWHYGREHTDFYERIERVAEIVELQNVVVRLMPKWMMPDACTSTGDRSDDRNTTLFLKKRAAGFPQPTNPHRYTYKRLL